MTLLLVCTVIIALISLAMFMYGVSENEDGIGIIGFVVLVISLIILITVTTLSDEEKPNKHVKITYEDACYELDGEFTNLDGKNICIVEE